MSKRCPDCGYVNDDSRIFCSACGEALDAELRLIKDLEKSKASAPQPKAAAPKDDDDDYVPPVRKQKKQSSAAPWIILGVIVVVAVAAWFFLNG